MDFKNKKLSNNSEIFSVSIIIPVFNNFHLTYKCLKSIQSQEYEFPIEIIVVDDGSKFLQKLKLRRVKGIRTFFSKQNEGYLKACNRGINLATGEIVILLNNDIEVHQNWLKSLPELFKNPKVGLVGAKMISPEGVLLEAGGDIFRDGSTLNIGRGQFPTDPKYCFTREVDYCSGAAIALPRKLLNEIGGYDTRYSPAYYEDTDLAMEVKTRGYKVLFDPEFIVTHNEHASYGEKKTSTINLIAQNQPKFFHKWEDELRSYPNPKSPE